MEAAQGDGDAGRAERPRKIKRARILIRLHADERDHAEIVVTPKAGDQRRHVDAHAGLVDRDDLDRDVAAEHLTLRAIGCNAVHGGQRIRGNHRSPPADHISIVVVM